MAASSSGILWKTFMLRIIFPVAMAIALYLGAFFFILIPGIEKNSMEHKREMIRELTNSTWNILAKLEYDESKGLLTRKQAQEMAVEQIGNMHYGQRMKDYFWINDMHPRMIIHPYRKDLVGKDLSDYTDPDGKKVFREFVEVVKNRGAGFVTYRWQWMDDTDRILPKISYVKGFAPWGWIIGTGIYFDDVKAEIAAIRMRLIEISLVILAIITVLLGSIIKQTYTTMHLQRRAEHALRESEAKYRTLVESAAEGMLMAIDGKYIYANRTVADLLEYTTDELSGMQALSIFPAHEAAGLDHIRELIMGHNVPERFETRLVTKSGVYRDVILSATHILLGEQSGFMAVVTDITKRKQAEDALGASEEKFRSIANNLNVAIFRRTLDDHPKFIEVNPALVRLLGYDDRDELLDMTITDLVAGPEDRKVFTAEVSPGPARQSIVTMKKRDGRFFIASLRETDVARGENGPVCRDGMLEDVTETVEREKDCRKHYSEMQAALSFSNLEVGSIIGQDPVTCRSGTSITACIALMNQRQTDILLVTDETGRDVGVVTNRDLRKIFTDTKHSSDATIDSIMSAPVQRLSAGSLVFEALRHMQTNGISHLFITGHDGAITGVLHIKDIVSVQTCSPAVLMEELRRSANVEEVAKRNAMHPRHIAQLIESGVKPRRINHFTTVIADTVVQRLIDLAIREIGPPPVPFSFIVFGSAGRQEQTLHTDQDNAIVFDDIAPENLPGVSAYFRKLGDNVCFGLNTAGYAFCEGGNMARNPQWCQPVSTWIEYFDRWINTAEAEDLLNTKIFFDFRVVYGDERLPQQLYAFIDRNIVGNNRFLQLLTRNILPLTPPIGFFGNFLVETVSDNRKALDMKIAMMPIVDYARIFALKYSIRATNTFDRLDILSERNIINRFTHKEISQAYDYCMQIRLRFQAEAVTAGIKKPDNYIDPKDLTSIEQKLLREIFTQIKNFQSGLSYEFTGQAGGV